MSLFPRWLAALTLCLVGLGAHGVAAAHKSSDAYLQIEAGTSSLKARWDIALRDLDVAIDLDSDADGRLTWGEVRSAWPRIEAYALPRLRIDGCELRPTGRALERRSDGAYAVILLEAACVLPAEPKIAYSLFRDLDPTHRGIAKIERPGLPVQVAVYDPSAGRGAPPASSAVATPDREGSSASAAALSRSAEAPSSRWQFFGEGMHHILAGYDHVLFLLCLLLPAVMRRTSQGWQPVDRLSQAILPIAGIVTAFTVAHSITLVLAALKLVSLPSSFIEPAIAVTIALAAIDNIRPIFPVRRVVVAFLFGLVHGFGFASVLAELDLPTADFAWTLLQFNLGIETGQLAIVVAVAAVLFGLRRWAGYRRWVIHGGSLLALVLAIGWLIQRTTGVALLPL